MSYSACTAIQKQPPVSGKYSEFKVKLQQVLYKSTVQHMTKNLWSSCGLWHRVTWLVRTVASQDPTASIFTIWRSYQETRRVQSVQRMGNRLNDLGFQFRHGQQIFSTIQIVQSPPSLQLVPDAWINRGRREVVHAPSCNAKVNNQ